MNIIVGFIALGIIACIYIWNYGPPHIHSYHSVRKWVPPYTGPDPQDPFGHEIWIRECRCGKTKDGF